MQGRPGDPDRRTAEDVDADLGKVLVESVKTSGRNRTWIRWLLASVVFNVFLSAAVVFAVVDGRSAQRRACEQANRQGTAYIRQWAPVLRAPRAPLREGATAAERAAYEANTTLRVQFERDFRYFEPIDC